MSDPSVAQMIERASSLLTGSVTILRNEQLQVVDIQVAIRETVEQAYPFVPGELVDDYGLWNNRFQAISGQLGRNRNLWTAEFHISGGSPCDYFANLVLGLTAATLDHALRSNPEIAAIDRYNAQNRQQHLAYALARA